jgi:hypothetical protein
VTADPSATDAAATYPKFSLHLLPRMAGRADDRLSHGRSRPTDEVGQVVLHGALG